MDGVNGGLKTNSEMCNSSLDIAGIIGDSIVDGPGMRTTVFVQGCPHRCNGCHNPESWEFGIGQKISVMEVFEKIKSNPLCRGVTFSGGEPFCQAAPLYELGKMLKEAGYAEHHAPNRRNRSSTPRLYFRRHDEHRPRRLPEHESGVAGPMPAYH